VKYTTQ